MSNRFPNNEQNPIVSILNSSPHAKAIVSGSPVQPQISGVERFYQTNLGVLVFAEITGLPTSTTPCDSPIFAFHIHKGSSCTGTADDPFADTLTHYNPQNCAHPYHAGDLPPLFGNQGIALSIFLTDRFTVGEIIDKTVVIHDRLDDFTTQPSGNLGTKIACGEIKRM